MKRYFVFFVSIVMIVLISTSLWGDVNKKVAVLPFAVHSSEDISYVKSGIWDMLISRLSSGGKIDVIEKHKIIEALSGIGEDKLTGADVYGLGKKINVDYIVWGSITKIGNSISLDGKLMDVATYSTPVGVFEQSQGMDEVIPKLNIFSEKINSHILGTTPPLILPDAKALQSKQMPSASQLPTAIQSSDALKSQEGTFTSIINPEFISGVGPLDRKGFWMSKRLAGAFQGMDIGDVNNDGLNEVVVIESNVIIVYQRIGEELKQLAKIPGKNYQQYLSVDVADINNNGTSEIIVTNVEGASKSVRSFVLEYQDKTKTYEPIASGLKWFLRVIKPGNDEPILLGQAQGVDKPFSNPIYQIGWKGKTYQETKKMKIPHGLSVYGITIDQIAEGGSKRIIALDEYDHLCIYNMTDKPLEKIHIIGGSSDLIWKSEEVFGGTSNAFDMNIDKSMGSRDDEAVYVNVRILTYDTNKDGKNEIIIVKNLSPGGRLFKNVRLFTKSEIYNLEWDGMGLIQNWKTKKIQGYVADYHFKDIDNDGENEVVLLIRLSMQRSIIAAYDLNI